MKPQRQTYIATFLLCAIYALCSGCTNTVANAEKSTKLAFHATDAFIQFDNQHRDELKAKAPQVHAAAEEIRTNAPGIFMAAWDAIERYKASQKNLIVTSTGGDPQLKQGMSDAVNEATQTGLRATEHLQEARRELSQPTTKGSS